jgi:hypothetical protein
MADTTTCDSALETASTEDISSMSNAAIARAFARRFPTITLKHFAACRKGRPYVVSHHSVHVFGAASELLRLGLLQEHMIPPGRKRQLNGTFGSEGCGSKWGVTRVRAPGLEASFIIMGDDADSDYQKERDYRDDLPADHPLQFCHPRYWPFGDPPELRAYFEQDRALARILIRADMTILSSKLGQMRKYGYSVHPGDGARMQQVVREFTEKLLQVFDGARVVSEQAPQLRLVASVEVGHG